jgi:hypothetical protein
MVHTPRRAVPEHLNRTVVDDAGSELPLLGLDDNMHTLPGASAASSNSESYDSVVEEELVAMPMEAVLVSLTGDYPGRSKLTNWQYPCAKYNGGWCMCLHKSDVNEVSNFVNQRDTMLTSVTDIHVLHRLHSHISREYVCFIGIGCPEA